MSSHHNIFRGLKKSAHHPHASEPTPEVEVNRSQHEHPHLFSVLSELKDLEHRSEGFVKEKLASSHVAIREAFEGNLLDILKEMDHEGKTMIISAFLRQEWLQFTESPVLKTFVRETESDLAIYASLLVEQLITSRHLDVSKLVLLLAIPFTTGKLNEQIWEQLFDFRGASRGEEVVLTKDVVQLLVEKVMTEARELWLKTKPQSKSFA